MEEYYFLFVLAFVWIIAASVQDLKKREVANWLNFSLIAIALAYRGFYALANNDFWFFVYGVLGFALFFAIGNLFYYSRVFAGGDAKLLFGLGAILPFQGFWSFFDLGFLFFILLFGLGAIYSLIYSVGIVFSRKKEFTRGFSEMVSKYLKYSWAILVLIVIILVFVKPVNFAMISSFGLLVLTLLFVYLKALDNCLLVLTPAGKLTEGDWLERDVRVGGKWIRKSVHGLSLSEIALLQKYKKSVYIKQGIPFVPAFLFAFVVFVILWFNGTGFQDILIKMLGG